MNLIRGKNINFKIHKSTTKLAYFNSLLCVARIDSYTFNDKHNSRKA